MSRQRAVIVIRLPRPTWPWRKSPLRTLGELIHVLSKGERAVYWRMLFGGKHWGVILMTHGRKGETPPGEFAEPVRLSPQWQARLHEGSAPKDGTEPAQHSGERNIEH